MFSILRRSLHSTARIQQKIYIGNLTWTTSEDTLRDVFAPHGEIVDTFVVRDRLSGKSRGFAFIQYSTLQEAEAAVAALDGAQNDGRELRVRIADQK